MSTTKLLTDVTSGSSTGEWVQLNGKSQHGIQASIAGTGAVTSTVVIEVTNDLVGALTLGTISLSGTTSATDGFAKDAPWAYIRARTSAISGTGATVNVTMAG